MALYNLIEYSDNYSNTSRRLWLFQRDESPVKAVRNPANVTAAGSSSFKYKSSLFK